MPIFNFLFCAVLYDHMEYDSKMQYAVMTAVDRKNTV